MYCDIYNTMIYISFGTSKFMHYSLKIQYSSIYIYIVEYAKEHHSNRYTM